MELILESTEGVPATGLLSVKVGEMKRQAPVSKLGQQFRFVSSPTEAVPVKVELLTPAAPAQCVLLDPLKERFVVDFGGRMRVQMQLKSAQDPDRIANAETLGSSGGFPSGKEQAAKDAAGYLERHGLLSLFQDLLHGLLVSRPEDPYGYLEEHLGRAKAVWKSRPAAQGAQPLSQPAHHGDDHAGMHGAILNHSKVEALMDILHRTSENLSIVLPLLPADLRELLVSPQLAEECQRQFEQLDTKRTGKLSPEDFMPIIVELSTAHEHSITREQCERLVRLLDTNLDGKVCQEEFKALTQIVLISAHLETDDGERMLEEACVQEHRFSEFLTILESDKNRINEVVPFLPDWMVVHLTSEHFMHDCMTQFDALDANRSGALEPSELLPVVFNLSQINSHSIDYEKCQRFAAIFDVHQNGVILRDEFIEFTQFLTVMNFLAHTAEGQHVHHAAMHVADLSLINQHIDILEHSGTAHLDEVLHHLPDSLVDELLSDGFARDCLDGFQRLDKNGARVLELAALFPLVQHLALDHPVSVDVANLRAFSAAFDQERTGVVRQEACVRFVEFMITMGYLVHTRDWHNHTIAHSREQIEEVLHMLSGHVDRLDTVMMLLPQDLQEELMSPEFMHSCLTHFKELDTDHSGVLEPRELIPVVLQLCEAHPFALTKEQCLRFVDMFDTERNGVIMPAEFINYARFMMIIGYMETEEGQLMSDHADTVVGKRRVQELLKLLEEDRTAIHKVIPLLPPDVYQHLTSADFVEHCHQSFADLDKDKNGVLDPRELFPVVVALSQASSSSVDMEQCKRFTAIFDIHGDGVIRKDEFLDFTQFLNIMSYLHSEEGQVRVAEGLVIMGDSKQIDELIDMLGRQRQDMQKVLAYLPDELRLELLHDHFTVDCLHKFDELDKDGNNQLDPTELYPVLLDMAQAHHLSCDYEQCKRFTEVFDDSRTGMISRSEFVNFARFQFVMSYLHTEDGRKTMQIVAAQLAGGRGGSEEQALLMAELAPAPGVTPANEATSADAYKAKAEQLQRENEELHRRLQRAQDLAKSLQQEAAG